MDLEIDFLPVGEKTQSGDAIILGYGNLSGQRSDYSIVVVDSGFKEDGQRVIDHIKNVYNTNVINLVISTHPDQDHSGGIPIILENLDVKKIWMHKPWEHTDNISKLFTSSSVSDQSVESRINKSLITAKEIEKIAIRKSIPIIEPFAGVKDDKGNLIVLGPDQKFYKEELIPNFRCTPESKDNSILSEIKEGTKRVVEIIKEFIDERWDVETLDRSGTTSAENNSSTILLLSVDDNHILLTSDVGQIALEKVICLLDTINYDYSKIKLVQVPHHGSHRNVNPDILNKIVGPKIETESVYPAKLVVVSVAKEADEKHPSKMVSNAFRRRGGPVHATSGGLKYHYFGNAPRKNKYPPSTPLPFFFKVEKHNDS